MTRNKNITTRLHVGTLSLTWLSYVLLLVALGYGYSLQAVPSRDGDGSVVLQKPGTLSSMDCPAFDCYRSFKKQLDMTKLFAEEIGINTRCFFASNTVNSLGEYYCEYPPIWIGEGQYDWSNFEAQVDDLLAYSPDARFLCLIDLNTPYWANRRYAMDSYDYISHFACDERWFSQTMRWMEDFMTYAEKKYGDRIIAYILSGGGTSEWYEYRRGYSSEVKDAGWQRWCKENGKHYGAVAPTVDKLRTALFENRIYDPATQREVIDYWKFHGEIISDAILRYAEKARSLLPPGKQLGVFFGYLFVSDSKLISFGHVDYERVLSCPNLDFIIAPASYSSRAMGEGSGSQTMFGTAMLHGKRLLHEVDHRPHDYFMWGTAYNSPQEDIAGNLREACFAIINHADMWWFDMWGQFYDDERLQSAIKDAHRIFEDFKDDNAPSVSEILYLGDPESLNYMNEYTALPHSVCELFRNNMAKTGMPYDCYSLSDVTRLDLAQYKVVCLPASMNITPEKEKLIRDYVCRDGRTVVWCYAPGLSDGLSLDADRVKTWAGVPFHTDGVSVTPMGGWTAVYAYDPAAFTASVLRGICADAGVHAYVDESLPVFANERLLCIHCKDGGTKKVSLKRKAAKVVELFSGEVVARNRKSFVYDFDTPDTRLFEIIY